MALKFQLLPSLKFSIRQIKVTFLFLVAKRHPHRPHFSVSDTFQCLWHISVSLTHFSVSDTLRSKFLIIKPTRCTNCRSQWPRGLRRRCAAARLLRSGVRIPPGAWMFVCCECCVLSGRGLCDELITRPEEFYRLRCVVEGDLETSRMRRPWPVLGRSATKKKLITFSDTYILGRNLLLEGSARRRGFYLYNTKQWQEWDIQVPNRIRTCNPSKRTAPDLHRRPRGHLDRHVVFMTRNIAGIKTCKFEQNSSEDCCIISKTVKR